MTMDMIENMIRTFTRLNIAGDVELADRLAAFKAKFLDPNTAKEIHNSDEIQAKMLIELKELQVLAADSEKIAALADAYREKINI